MTDNKKKDREKRERLLERTRSELVAAQMKNAEQFDRSVLTLSSAFLAISMGFMRDVVIAGEALHRWMLLTSWGLFALTIITTLFGLLYGQNVLKKLIDGAYKFYILKDKNAYKISEKLPPRITILNWFVGFLFLFAVSFTVLFVILNSMETEMTDESKILETGEVLKKSIPANTFEPVTPVSETNPENPSPQQSGQGQDSQETSNSDSKD